MERSQALLQTYNGIQFPNIFWSFIRISKTPRQVVSAKTFSLRTQKDSGNLLFWLMVHRLHELNRYSYEIIFMFLAKKNSDGVTSNLKA
jgi:hypothetical protein